MFIRLQDGFRLTIPALWMVWLIYWYASARDVKATRWRASLGSQALYRIPAVLTVALLMGVPSWLPQVLQERFLPATLATVLAGTIVVVVGLGFTVWANNEDAPLRSCRSFCDEGYPRSRSFQRISASSIGLV
jgi:hypothetical protein